MQKIIDTIHNYKGYFGCASQCRIRVYHDPEQTPVVIATELPENEGTSVTNMAEPLATEWARDEATGEANEILWIEQYQEERNRFGRLMFEETFALVTFRPGQRGELTNPEWHYITRAEVERMIGEAVR
jgi:hypothetical protein